jgi:hypothetical protein
MRNLLPALAAILLALPAHAQSTLYANSSSVGIGTSSPTTGVALDIGSNTNSMLLPIGTTGQRPTGVAGMLRYNSTNSVPEFYTTNWLPVPLTASSPLAINSTTGNITCSTCNTSAANVISISGDGVLISNSTSTGAVTLTLGNAAAYSVWGNNTSSSATPAYTNSPTLSGAITDIQSIGATSTDGFVLTDTTAATSGNPEWSPRVRWTGQGWKTNATAASQEVDAIAEVQPVQGTVSPTFNWVLSGQINGGGYGPLLTVSSGGEVGIGTTSPSYSLSVVDSQNDSTAIQVSNPNSGSSAFTSLYLGNDTSAFAGALFVNSSTNTTDYGGANSLNLYTGTSAPLTFLTDATERMRITSGGDVGIGTASPANPLSVNGIIQSLTGGFKFPDGTTQTTASTGSGGMVLLATVNASGASSVSFNSTYITTAYNKYVIEFDGVYTSDAGALYLTVSTNNGSSYLSSNYNWGVWSMGSGPYSNNASSQNQIDLTGNTGFGSTSSTSTKISSGTLKVSNLAQSVQANVMWQIFFGGATSPQNSGIGGMGFNTTTTAINAIKITDGGGGTITGNFHLYGLSGT